MGGRDHAQNRPGGKPAAFRREHREGPRGAPSRRHVGRPPAGRWRPRGRARGSRPQGLRLGAIAAGLRGPDGPAFARSGSQGDAGVVVAGPAPAGPGHDGRRERARRASGARRDERDRAQCDHEHAVHVGCRLGRVLRERQPGGCGAARQQQLRRDGFSHARQLSARDRGSGPRLRPHRDRGRATSRSPPPNARLPRVRAATPPPFAANRTRAITSSRGGVKRSSRAWDFALP